MGGVAYYAFVLVIIAICAIFIFAKKESFGVPNGSTIAVITIPPHNSGRASMWVPAALGEPSYNDRKVAYVVG